MLCNSSSRTPPPRERRAGACSVTRISTSLWTAFARASGLTPSRAASDSASTLRRDRSKSCASSGESSRVLAGKPGEIAQIFAIHSLLVTCLMPDRERSVGSRARRQGDGMRYREIGNTGVTVSEIGFGVWTVTAGWWGEYSDQQAVTLLRQAYDRGGTFFDTADRSEERR